MHRAIAYISFLLLSRAIFAQEHESYPPQQLDTATIYASGFIESKTDSLFILNDSAGITALTPARWLAGQTPFQTRIYGAGMTAGLSLRGAPVSHVLVVWNGVPLNSPFNGQADLNMLSAGLPEKMALYRGGLSQTFGSGAMAGALVMNDPLEFDGGAHIRTHLRAGQYGLRYGQIQWHQSGKHWSVRLGADLEDNDNDFRIPSIGYVNRNAHITGRHLNLGAGFRQGKNLWQTYLLHNYSDRYLPGTRTTLSRSRLLMEQTAWQVNWKHRNLLRGTLNVLGAMVDENYRYFHIAGEPVSGEGAARSYFFKAAYDNRFGPVSIRLNYAFSFIEGQTLNFERHIRPLHTLSANAEYRYKNVDLEAGLRLQKTPESPIPPTGFVQAGWQAFTHYKTALLYSTNFRLPTFNDLYWQPGGNPSLRPESNSEWEWIHQWSSKSLYLRLSAYYRINRNLIRWMPGNNGLWHPVNIERTHSRGLEWSGRWKKTTGPWNFSLSASYNIQRVIDRQTGGQLSYTPQYLWTTGLRAGWKKIYLRPQVKFQSFYYTDASNTHFAPQILLVDLQAGWRYKRFRIDLDISNLLDTYYEWMPGRPMPGRTGSIGLTYDINLKPKNNN